MILRIGPSALLSMMDRSRYMHSYRDDAEKRTSLCNCNDIGCGVGITTSSHV